MLFAFIAGFGLLAALVLTINWFSNADPKAVLKALKWGAGLVIFAAFLGLLVTGRLGWAMAALFALVPWIGRLINILLIGHTARNMFGGRNPFRGMGSSGGSSTGASGVSSRYLDMSLDHATGAMDGQVLDGPLAGRPLSSLTQPEALALWQFVQDDADSLRLLEAWLDRAHPDWRDVARQQAEEEGAEGPRASSSGTMTRQEALDILGLDDGATADQVRAAYRRLMALAHPDRGGSTWMAAKLNEARAILLDGRS